MDQPTLVAPSRVRTTLRPLGSLEQVFWLCDQNHPAHFALAAEIEGAATPAAWRGALDALQRRHPLLAVGIAAGEDGVPSFVQQPDAPIPLRVVPGADWPAEVARELSRPFLAGEAPLLRATLLHGARAAVCVLTAHHSVADGISLTYLFRDLLQSLARRPLTALPVPASHEARLRLPAGVPPAPPAADRAPLASYREWEGAPPFVDRLRLPAALSRELRTLARQERTTVHGALAAALTLARTHLADAPSVPARILSPIDTRKLLGLTDECALVVEAAVTRPAQEPGDTFWDLARRTTDALVSVRTLAGVRQARAPLCQASAGGLDVAAAAGLFAQVYGHHSLLSNLGAVRFGSDFGALRLTGMWGPAVLFGLTGAQTVGAITVDGVISLLHTSYHPIPALLTTAERLLAVACAG